jgi:hypothetical protein
MACDMRAGGCFARDSHPAHTTRMDNGQRAVLRRSAIGRGHCPSSPCGELLFFVPRTAAGDMYDVRRTRDDNDARWELKLLKLGAKAKASAALVLLSGPVSA